VAVFFYPPIAYPFCESIFRTSHSFTTRSESGVLLTYKKEARFRDVHGSEKTIEIEVNNDKLRIKD